MHSVDSYNPIVITVYFFAVIFVSMFCMNPILLIISLMCAVIYSVIRIKDSYKKHLYCLLLFIIVSVINPLVSHNGKIVLFVLNDSPITLEALAYGVTMAMAIIGVIYWFSLFTNIMTSDKLLYLLGSLSPKLSLIISMGIRYVNLFAQQMKKIKESQTALGLYKGENVVDRVKGNIRVFSILITWALENGITTADSMAARGYGVGKRSHFTVFAFKKKDGIMLGLVLLLLGVTIMSVVLGGSNYTFYPEITIAIPGIIGSCGYAAYFILSMLFIIIEVEESLKWKYLQSKI